MGVPQWWEERRFGVFVHANLATVPAWAPIGQYAEWYRSHLGEPVADVILHARPMAEVLAHHRERWGHIATYDDFWPLLTFDRFDADEWAGLVRDAGAGYTVFTTKHHDGLCWWDAPGTDRTVLREGPRRDVLAEYAAACERADIVFGTYYSLLDWADPRYPGDDYVDEVLHPHVLDLVERHGTRVLWGDGHWGHGPDRWRSDALLRRVRDVRPDIVVNDRWWADADVTSFEYQTPDAIRTEPWELCRGIGHSFGHNRAERAEHHLDGRGIVALLTEVVAKGGNLLLDVGPAADGTIPELQAAPLRDAGAWIRAHADVLNGSRPWRTWGDEHTRYTVTDEGLHAIDLGGRGDLAALGRAAGRVREVRAADGAPLLWEQTDHGLHLRRLDRRPLGPAAVYHVAIEEPPAVPVELFPPTAATSVELAALLADAVPGTVVQLGEGTYLGPARVPPGVTVRGLGADRTVVDGRDHTALTLAEGARVEHLTARGGGDRVGWFPVPTVRVAGADATLLACAVDGHVIVGADRTRLRACRLTGVVASGASGVTITRSSLTGTRWDVGIEIDGGARHVVDSCTLRHHLCAIRITRAVEPTVRGNDVEARWWGVHLVGTEGAVVTGNAFHRTMRAVDVEGGTLARVQGNAVTDGDSGCLVERGASGTVVVGNRWERCRIGLLAWDAGDIEHRDNAAVDLHDPDHTVTIGPA